MEHEGPLVLGTVESVPVLIQVPTAAEEVSSRDERPLRVSVNVGRFSDVKKVKPGVYRTTYTLPKTRHPQVALVAVWRETGPTAPIAFLRIPLSGKTTLPVGTRRGHEVSVVVGEEIFGPVTAGRRGRAVVPIVVPPGVEEVVARSTSGTTESQKTVPVDLPPYNRLTLAVTPYLIEADGSSSATVHAYYDVKRARPIERVDVTAPRGEVTPIAAEGNRYRFRYVPERGDTDQQVELAVRVRGDRTSTAKVLLSLGTPTPQRISARIDGPLPLVAGETKTGEVSVLLTDKLGLGVDKKVLSASLSDGKVTGIENIGDGRYRITVAPPESYPKAGEARLFVSVKDRPEVSLETSIPVAPPPWPAEAKLSIDPSQPVSDGSAFRLEVEAWDFAGAPIDAPLSVTATPAVVGKLHRIADGRYEVEITPEEGIQGVDLAVRHRSGRFERTLTAKLRRPPALVSVAAKIGGAFYARLVPTGGLEVQLRPPWGERRLTLSAGIGYRQVTRDIEPGGPFPENADLSARLRTVPATVGLAYDLFLGKSWRAYAGAAFILVGYEHQLQTDDLFDTPIQRGVGVGGEGGLGFEWYGVFLEAAAGYTRIRAEGLVGPDLLVSLLAGYRLGLF